MALAIPAAPPPAKVAETPGGPIPSFRSPLHQKATKLFATRRWNAGYPV